jgi:hypothetical protein
MARSWNIHEKPSVNQNRPYLAHALAKVSAKKQMPITWIIPGNGVAKNVRRF